MRLSPARYTRRNLWHSLGVNLAIAAVVACIALVLTGALLVGDSMRFSLRFLTSQRLGPIDSAIRRDDFFLPNQALTTLKNTRLWTAAVPSIVLDASLTIDESAAVPIACGATVVGVDDDFWNAWFHQNEKADSHEQTSPSKWNENEIIVNRQLANALVAGSRGHTIESAHADLIFLEPDSIPAENTFGKTDDVHARYRVQIRGVIENDIGPGSFSFASDQTTPALAFVPLKRFQKYLDRPGQVNTIFLLNRPEQAAVSADMIAQAVADKQIFPLSELGIDVSHKTFTTKNASKSDDLICVYLGATRFLFSAQLKNRITEVLSPLQADNCRVSPVCIYLANTIEPILASQKSTADSQSLRTSNAPVSARSSVPYSLVAGIDPKLLTKFLAIKTIDQPGDAIWINRFLADELQLVPGNRIRLTFFHPDDPSGLHRETNESFTVAGIIPDSSPLNAYLVPTVHGLTDVATLADWNPTFPFDARRIAQADEEFWKKHHTAPKAFIPLARAEKLFGSRFGSISSFCVFAPQAAQPKLADSIRQRLQSKISLDVAGSPIIPLRAQALDASSGTTPFHVLFLCFSSFLIASVLVMLFVLVRLSLDLKYRELGVLMTLGFSSSRICRLVLGELLIPLFWGSLIGTLLGSLYTRVMIYGLCHWWLGAIGTPFVRWHGQPGSLLCGMAITFASAVLAVLCVLQRIRKMQPGEAIRRVAVLPLPAADHTLRFSRFAKPVVASALLLTALTLACVGANITNLAPDMKAGLFFGSASMVLAGVILLFDSQLTRHAKGVTNAAGMSLFRLVGANLSRHQWRTMLTVTLLASSLFVVGATGIFRLNLPQTPRGKTPPLCVETRLPIFENLMIEQGRDNLFTDPDDAKILAPTRFIPFRVRPGQRTGCSNLYRAGDNLRLLGVPQAYIQQLDEPVRVKYKHLELDLSSTIEYSTRVAPIPILLDRNTAMYALQIYSPGATLHLRNDQGQIISALVVDFLDHSIFQSEVIMSEANLLKYFPEVAGWQFFYVEQLSQPENTLDSTSLTMCEGAVARTLGDYGPTIETVPARLGRFFRVQNGYITIFQTLGAFGILLGTLGLAGLQVQDLFARRRELALLQTIGFSRKRIFTMLFLENAFMLLLAVIMAWLATIVAVWPQLQNQLLAGTLSWTALVPSAFFTLPAVGVVLVGLLSFAFVWRISQKQTGFQYLLET